MEFPRKEYWSELSFPCPGDLPYPGIKPTTPALAGRFFATSPQTLSLRFDSAQVYRETEILVSFA